jgi:hypothetical protein
MRIFQNPRIVGVFLFVFCVLPVIYAITFHKEIFPWSSFPMYSGLDTGKDLVLLSAYVSDAAGNETAIEKTGILRPKYEYRWRIPIEAMKDRALNDAELEKLQTFANIFKDDLENKKLKFKKIRFYYERWDSFSGPARYRPDERRVLYEQNFE